MSHDRGIEVDPLIRSAHLYLGEVRGVVRSSVGRDHVVEIGVAIRVVPIQHLNGLPSGNVAQPVTLDIGQVTNQPEQGHPGCC